MRQLAVGNRFSMRTRERIVSLHLDFNSTDYRKSMQSTCVHPGIYPDIFDCSLFHWCHVNGYHQIRKCPGGLHFDPKTTLCLSSRLVCRDSSIHLGKSLILGWLPVWATAKNRWWTRYTRWNFSMNGERWSILFGRCDVSSFTPRKFSAGSRQTRWISDLSRDGTNHQYEMQIGVFLQCSDNHLWEW